MFRLGFLYFGFWRGFSESKHGNRREVLAKPDLFLFFEVDIHTLLRGSSQQTVAMMRSIVL